MLNRLRALLSPLAHEQSLTLSGDAQSSLQRYMGYEPADVDMLRTHASVPARLSGDHCIDGFGVKTLYECVPFASPDSLDLARLQHPIPDDDAAAEPGVRSRDRMISCLPELCRN